MAAIKAAPLICAQNSSQLVLPTLQPFMHVIMDFRSEKFQMRAHNLYVKFFRGSSQGAPKWNR